MEGEADRSCEGKGSLASLRKTEEEAGEKKEAVKEIDDAFSKGKTVLLQGGAARISVIEEAAREALAAGHNVLLLVPEISLSRRLQDSLAEAFGEALLVFHSAETAGNRREVATMLRRNDRPRLVLGTRSAIFLPFKDLGLVIVEEEHDMAYKQDARRNG